MDLNFKNPEPEDPADLLETPNNEEHELFEEAEWDRLTQQVVSRRERTPKLITNRKATRFIKHS